MAPYLGGITSKRANVLFNPLESRQLILQPKVQRPPIVGLSALREAKRTDTIVEADVYNRRALFSGLLSATNWRRVST